MRFVRRPPTLACIMEEDRSTQITANNASMRPENLPNNLGVTSDILANQIQTNTKQPQAVGSGSASYLSQLLATEDVVDPSTGGPVTQLDGNWVDRLLTPTLPLPGSGEEAPLRTYSSRLPQLDARADKNSGSSLKVSLIRHKLSKNQIVRNFLAERGSFILKSSAICDSCDHDKKEKSATVRPLRMCPLCRSHLPPVANGTRGSLYMPPVKRSNEKPLTFDNAVRAACAARRRSLGVWTTILVVWVIALVLICDLQDYSSSSPPNTLRTTVHPPNEASFSAHSVLESNNLAPSVDGGEEYVRDVVVIRDTMDLEAFSLDISELENSLQTTVHSTKEVSTTAPLHVQVFYEPLCPDSRHFIRYQLKTAIEQLGDHIDLQMVPYGKATTTEVRGELSFQCQHGPIECLANKIHSCVVREIKDQTLQFKIIDCMIADNYKPKSIAQKCVTEVMGSGHWAPIQLCYTSRTGDQALKHMGSLTHSLEPSVSFIPTITINQSQDDQKYMLQDFTKVLCKRFKGTLPSACS